ncbi:unnamed protein product, partial [Didymodactylos carnosus]
MELHVAKLVCILTIIRTVLTTCGPGQTMQNEGVELCCYYDTKHIPTIGYGFNLQRSDAASVLERYGLTLSEVLNDCVHNTRHNCLLQNQAAEIFNSGSYVEATACVEEYVSGLPPIVKAGLIDVAFAGCATLNQFTKMKTALEMKAWTTAANELRNSAWCTQVKQTRCNLDYQCIASSGSTQ